MLSHYSWQQEFMLILHALTCIVIRDRTDHWNWSFATANLDDDDDDDDDDNDDDESFLGNG